MERPIVKIEGIDLKRDPAISFTCEVANDSAKTSRTALYLVVFVSIIAFIAYWNSRTNSWHMCRYNLTKTEHQHVLDSLLNTQLLLDSQPLKADSAYANNIVFYKNQIAKTRLEEKLKDVDKKYEELLRVHFESVIRVKVPVIGATFDLNDLAIIAGLALAILQFMFLYASKREYENLMLSFLSITKRYINTSDEKKFEDVLAQYPEEERPVYLAAINRTRRESHYNYLTMNEIYTLPNLISNHQRSFTEKLLTFMIYLPPFAVHTIVMASDIFTSKTGMDVSPDNTIETLMMGSGFWVIIFITTYQQIRLKVKFMTLWDSFYNNDYKLDKSFLNN